VLDELVATRVIRAPAIEGSRPMHAAMPSTAAASTAPARAATLAEADLRAREERVALRERQLAEQQRILSREYRLLQSLHASPDAEPGAQSSAPEHGPRAPRAAGTRTITVAAPPPPVPLPGELPGSGSGVWARMRRSIFRPLHAALGE
jgi:hypothetical protein